MKICSKCKIDKELEDFHKLGDSHRNTCKLCMKEYHANYFKKNRDKILKSNKSWYSKNKEYHKILRQEWYSNNKEEYLIGRKTYYQENKSEFRQRDSKRRAIEINARPNWVSLTEMKLIYQNCPEGFEVDHIIPLNNQIVCGLDVPWNLQYLEKSKNRSKGNKLEVSIG